MQPETILQTARPAVPDDHRQPANPQPEAIERPAPPDQDGSLSQARRQRIREYHAEVLGHEKPLSAVLGSLSAGLMEIGVQLEEEIHESSNAEPLTVEHLMNRRPAIEAYLKVLRQIDRFAQLEVRMRPSERRKAQPR